MKKLLVVCFVVVGLTSVAQTVSGSGQVGWASPVGSLFTQDGEKLASGGLGYGADVLYNSDALLDGKLGVGIGFNGAVLIAVGENIDGFRFYGLSNYGLKGQYNFTDGAFRPYGALELGVGVLSTPEVTSGTDVILPAEYGFSFGLRPELGFELESGFKMSVGFQVPMSYKIEEYFEGTRGAGAWQISLGYRQTIEI